MEKANFTTGEGQAANDGMDLLWGTSAIAKAIERTDRQTLHLLETQAIPARKVGGRWCASRRGLLVFFSSMIEGKVGR
jgi:hypothetical protein